MMTLRVLLPKSPREGGLVSLLFLPNTQDSLTVPVLRFGTRACLPAIGGGVFLF